MKIYALLRTFINKKATNRKEIYNILQPYNNENFYSQDEENEDIEIKLLSFTWDWYEIGGRYRGGFKLKADINEYNEYRWRYIISRDEERNNRLFISSLLSTLKAGFKQEPWRYREEDWLTSIGLEDGYIYVDGGRQKDILNLQDAGCYVYITPDGSAFARTSWDGKKFVKDEQFDEKYQNALNNNMDGFITILDIHD